MRKINEIFKVNGLIVKTIERNNSCRNCCFSNHDYGFCYKDALFVGNCGINGIGYIKFIKNDMRKNK